MYLRAIPSDPEVPDERQRTVAAQQVPSLQRFILARAIVEERVEFRRLLFPALLNEPHLIPAQQVCIKQRRIVRGEDQLGIVGPLALMKLLHEKACQRWVQAAIKLINKERCSKLEGS